jgi:DNA-binding NarL/FixJ family response regulator
MSSDSVALQPINILIVDDHRLLLNGTMGLVRHRFPNAKIVSAQTVQDALTTIPRFKSA